MPSVIGIPGFFWPEAAEHTNSDVKVHEWIKQFKSASDWNVGGNWDAVLLGVPLSRSSISVSGASEFPEFFRRSWKGYSTYNIDYEADVQTLKVADLGDVSMHVTDIGKCHANIKAAMTAVRNQFPNSVPVSIGGDHSITAMLISGFKEAEPEKEIGIIQFDTHLDLRDLADNGPSNGTPIRNLIEQGIVQGKNVFNIGLHGFYNGQSLIAYAREKGVNYVTLKKAREQGIAETVKHAIAELEKAVDVIYLTLDMDVLDIGFAPGVPASTPGGMTTEELFTAVYTAGLSEKVRAMDIVCLDPTRDGDALPTVKAGTYAFLTFMTALHNR